MLALPYIQDEYPNIGEMLENMPAMLSSMAIYCLATLPESQLKEIEEMLPQLMDGLENKDQDGVRLMLLTFGIPDDAITDIFAVLPSFEGEEIVNNDG